MAHQLPGFRDHLQDVLNFFPGPRIRAIPFARHLAGGDPA